MIRREATHVKIILSKNEVPKEVIYTDPKDSKHYAQPGVDPSVTEVYKVYMGQEEVYCRPYQEPAGKKSFCL